MVEIAKAISYNSRVIIMDEPTAPLSNSEIESLFAIIGEMKKSGISIIYISHRMDEIKRICDRATILRDGQYISTVDVASTSLDDIIAAMVGRKIAYVRKGRDKSRILEDEILRVEHLNSGSKVKDVSFSLRRVKFSALQDSLVLGVQRQHGLYSAQICLTAERYILVAKRF